MDYRIHIIAVFITLVWLPGFSQVYQDQPEYKYFHCPNSTIGCYESFKDFHAGKPVVTSGFRVEKRNINEIRDSWAAGYKLYFDNGSAPSRKMINKIWGIYFDDTLFINRKFFQDKKGFDKVYCMGSYGYFHGINTNSSNLSDNQLFNTTMLFGLIGASVVASNDYMKNNQYGKFPHVMIYLIDYETGMVSPLTRFKLEKILEEDPQLLELYGKEVHKSSMMVMHAYIDTFAERHRNK